MVQLANKSLLVFTCIIRFVRYVFCGVRQPCHISVEGGIVEHRDM